jgi:gamma-glutamylaminecyclotransferase
MRLFVYGTLKRGQSRHRYLAGQSFVGAACTGPLYRLYNVGEYPALVRSADGLAIEGEVWDVDEACLRILDRVEGCNAGLYRRDSIDLAPPNDSLGAVTYFYALDVGGLPECGTCWLP